MWNPKIPQNQNPLSTYKNRVLSCNFFFLGGSAVAYKSGCLGRGFEFCFVIFLGLVLLFCFFFKQEACYRKKKKWVCCLFVSRITTEKTKQNNTGRIQFAKTEIYFLWEYCIFINGNH